MKGKLKLPILLSVATDRVNPSPIPTGKNTEVPGRQGAEFYTVKTESTSGSSVLNLLHALTGV
jgi:hypothetical protein